MKAGTASNYAPASIKAIIIIVIDAYAIERIGISVRSERRAEFRCDKTSQNATTNSPSEN
jgi:hypothetical protein